MRMGTSQYLAVQQSSGVEVGTKQGAACDLVQSVGPYWPCAKYLEFSRCIGCASYVISYLFHSSLFLNFY